MEDASILHLRVVSRDSHGRCCGVDDHKRQPVRSAACDVDIRPALGDLGQARRFRGWILLAESALWITDEQSIVLKSYLIQNKVASTRVFAGEVIDLGRCLVKLRSRGGPDDGVWCGLAVAKSRGPARPASPA
jgi:hypothetical protein